MGLKAAGVNCRAFEKYWIDWRNEIRSSDRPDDKVFKRELYGFLNQMAVVRIKIDENSKYCSEVSDSNLSCWFNQVIVHSSESSHFDDELINLMRSNFPSMSITGSDDRIFPRQDDETIKIFKKFWWTDVIQWICRFSPIYPSSLSPSSGRYLERLPFFRIVRSFPVSGLRFHRGALSSLLRWINVLTGLNFQSASALHLLGSAQSSDSLQFRLLKINV
jgi:hypothetical protein